MITFVSVLFRTDYSRGIGTPKDYNEAMKWFKAAKESADAKLNWSDPEDTKVLKSVIRIAEIQTKETIPDSV